MKKIIVNNGYYIRTDKWSYEVFRTVDYQDNDGNPKSRAEFIGSYPTLALALRNIAHSQTVQGDGTITLCEYVDRLENAYKEITELIKGDRR